MHSEIELDALREITNIGAGHAATALSVMLSRPIRISVPQVRMLPFDEVANALGGTEILVVGILMRVAGQIQGTILLIIPKDYAKKITEVMLNKDIYIDGFSEMEKSTLTEVGNILASSYVAALADFTKLNIKISVPAFAYDMAGAILSVPLSLYGYMGDTAFLLDTEFVEGFDGMEFHFILIPDAQSTQVLLKAIGVNFIE